MTGMRFAPILAVHFLGTLGFSLAIPFLVFIVLDLGGATWTYGLLGATYSAFQLLGAPLLGRWSDRAGRRPVLIASQVGTLSAWLLFFVALSIPADGSTTLAGATLTVPLALIFIARALDGATGGNVSVANAYVADMTRDAPELRQIAFGRMGMAASLGFVIGPAAAGLLGGTSLGPKLPIGVAAAFAALTTIAIVVLLDEPDGRCREGPPPPGAVEAGLHQQAKPCHPTPEESTLRRGITSKSVAPVLLATFLLFAGFNFFYAAFPVHAAEAYGWSTTELGAFFAVLSGMMMVAQGPVLSAATPRFRPPAVFAVGVGLLLVSVLTFRAPAGVLTYVGAACFALGNGLSWPTFQARLAEVGGDEQGWVQGAATSAGSLASIIGLVGGGLSYGKLGGGVFIVAAALFGAVLAFTRVWFGRPSPTVASARE